MYICAGYINIELSDS